ncbi:MAG: GAF domain-containing sensor histidine kinase [Armatimonadota bacterium]|nr:GAF domain-containing sensor histidine kinase [Armatimonadota bacterium]MDR5703734.1 GAF domain-containing sensor histidine kinase [Armatimonadota bacterium]
MKGGKAKRSQGLRELAILNGAAEALNSATDIRQALERTLKLIAEFLGLHTGWVWLLDQETNQFYCAAVHNLPPYLQEPVKMTGRSCWCISEFLDGELAPKNIDIMECSRLRNAIHDHAQEATHGLRYHATIPLFFQGKPLGIMNVTGPSWRKLTRTQLRLLSTIAYGLGIAVERAQLAEKAMHLARVEERTRLAREVHDTLAQGLTAIGLRIEAAGESLTTDPERAREHLEKALDLVRKSLAEARRSVRNLRYGLPGGKSLPQALSALGRALTAESGIRVHIRADEPCPLTCQVEAELYRIAQEALTNVRKHARAREVHIRLRVTKREAALVITDDGQGFDPLAVKEHGGYGILGMMERAGTLGGRLRISSRVGRGTTIVASVPIQEGMHDPPTDR